MMAARPVVSLNRLLNRSPTTMLAAHPLGLVDQSQPFFSSRHTCIAPISDYVVLDLGSDPMSKHVVADDVLPDGTFVPAGSSITYSIYSVGRMRTTWGDDCMEFCPERWLSADGKTFIMHDSYKFVAFNAGPRICLGKDLAYLQMKSVAAAVLLRHKLNLVPGHKVEQKMSLTLFMKYGLKVNIQSRDLEGIVAKIMEEEADLKLVL